MTNLHTYRNMLANYWQIILFSTVSIVLIIMSFFYSFFGWVALLINIAALLFLKSDKFIIILISLLPWAYVFKVDNFPTSLFVILCMLTSIVFIVRMKKINEALILLLLVFSLLVFSHFKISSIAQSFTLIKIITSVVLLYCLCYFYNPMSFSTLAILFIISVILSSLVAYFLKDNSVLNTRINSNNFLVDFQFSRFKGLQNDPNYYNSSLIISLLICFFMFIKKMLRVSFFIYSTFLIYFGLITLSKSFFLLLILWFFSIFIYSIIEKKRFITSSIFLMSLFSGSYLFFGNSALISTIIDRFSEGGTDITTGRLSIFVSYLEYFKQKPVVFFFGNGLETLNLYNHAAHNTLIESIYYFGILGTFILVYCVVVAFKLNRSSKSNDIYALLIGCFVVLIYSFLSGMTTIELPFVIFVIYMIISFVPPLFKDSNSPG